jgi:hypothetical protein
MKKTLSGSLLWWLTVSSLVNAALDNAGDDAFALILEARTVAEVRPDGTLRRTRLRSLLPGGTSSVKFDWVGSYLDDPTKITVDMGEPGTRWRFLEFPWVLEHVRSLVNPAVTVDTREPQSCDYALWHTLVTSDIIVVPHTAASEEYLRGYFAWLKRGRPLDGAGREFAPADLPWPDSWIPRQADFRVTGLFENGEWTDPSHLEAARSLLQSRFDLRIGLWDLARNPVLQESLLTPIPEETPSTEAAEVPQAAVRRKEQRAAQTANRREAVTAIFDQLAPLRSLGWGETFDPVVLLYMLPLAQHQSHPGPLPLAWLEMQTKKNETLVAAAVYYHEEVDLTGYLQERQQTFQEISDSCQLARPDSPRRPILWRIQSGWADDIEWSKQAEELATMTQAWLQALDDLAAEVLQAYEKRHGG